MNDYSDRLAIDVVTAPLAEIDRRTLSQAWYSALHLARDGTAQAQAPRASAAAATENAPVAQHDAQNVDRASGAPIARAVADASVGGKIDAQAERRRAPSVLARKIERVLSRAEVPARRMTLTLSGQSGRGGRIELLVRTVGAATQVIAVCAPGAHARVVAALAHARFSLARRGIGLQARVQGARR